MRNRAGLNNTGENQHAEDTDDTNKQREKGDEDINNQENGENEKVKKKRLMNNNKREKMEGSRTRNNIGRTLNDTLSTTRNEIEQSAELRKKGKTFCT